MLVSTPKAQRCYLNKGKVNIFSSLCIQIVWFVMEDDSGILSHENTAWLEKEVMHGLRLWYAMKISLTIRYFNQL